MRVLGYIVLFLLALYFILVKPYIAVKRIEWDVEGVGFSFEHGLKLGEILLYVPRNQIDYHLFLKGISIKPWQIEATEVSFIEVSKRPPSEKPFDYDFSNLTRLANRLNLRVGSLYVSINYVPHGESFTLFVPETLLKAGNVSSKDWTKVYWMHGRTSHYLEVFLHKARTEGDVFYLDGAEVRSNYYSFRVRGIWKGKKGSFEADGKVMPIEGKNFHVGALGLKLKGNLEYTKIRADFSGYLESLEVKGRRSYTNLSVRGNYLWEWREKSHISANIGDSNTMLTLDYSLRDKVLRAEFSGLLVDSKLLGVKSAVLGFASGNLWLDRNKNSLILQAQAPNLRVDQQDLMNVSLRLDLDYKEVPKGHIELSATQPFSVSFRGAFLNKDVRGDLTIMNYPVNRDGFSFWLSYSGLLALREGTLYLRGGGKLSKATYKDIFIGAVDYNLELEGERYNTRLLGENFSMTGSGSIKDKSFSGKLSMTGMNVFYRGMDFRSLMGDIALKLEGDSLVVSGKLQGHFSRESVSSSVGVNFDVRKKADHLSGFFDGRLEEARLLGLYYRNGSFNGRVEGESLHLSFDLGEDLRGKGQYSFKDGSYSFEGSIKHRVGDLSIASTYSLKGVGNQLNALLSGSGSYKNLSFPLKAQLSAEKDRVKGFVEGFTLKDGLIALKVDGIKVDGDRSAGKLYLGPVLMTVGGQTLSRIDFSTGEYKDGEVHVEGKLSGAIEGYLKVKYKQALLAWSEGYVNLEKMFSLIRSRVLADGEGTLAYKLQYDKSGLNLWAKAGKLVLRSRYVSVPLQGSFELGFKNNSLSGHLKLYGNQKASLLASFSGDQKNSRVNFDLTQLPVIYRNENLKASLFLSGKGNIWSDYKNVNIGGDFYTFGFLNLQKWTRGKTTPLESYKRVSLNINISSTEPIRINLPEGFLYADIVASLKETLYEPDYKLKAYFKGGNLKYFEKTFYVRRGELSYTPKESHIDLSLVTLTPDYSILIDVKGNPQYPKVLVRSEPPRDSREVLTALVLGSQEGEGLIPVAGALVSQIPQVSGILKGARRLTGVDVKLQVSPALSPTGEVGINATISKDITERISVEHRQSTLRNPKETYTGGEAKLTPGTSIGGRIYSDRSQEVRVRIRRKFDF
ncbi:MAG: translocation/assembly module TamB domain-containing protein [Aquificaceae bacterium]|nr:translocation/assembly module TamB [Aquificaceae bacterium]MDW8423621.1 translocation/assembly module TamB domain-containing protein [Aquificaceae bacterium]